MTTLTLEETREGKEVERREGREEEERKIILKNKELGKRRREEMRVRMKRRGN
jgi:hypothetical protein